MKHTERDLRPLAWLLLAAIVGVLSLPVLAQIQIQPQDLVGNDSQVDALDVQTKYYRIRFNLLEFGSAASMVYRPLEHDLRAENYYSTRNTMFREWVRLAAPDPITGLTRNYNNSEVRAPIQMVKHRVIRQTERELVVEFERPAGVAGQGDAPWTDRLLIRRRVLLQDESPAVRVEVEVLNTDNQPHPVLLDIFNGLSLGRNDSAIHLPGMDNKVSGIDAAVERSSQSLFAPEIAGAWMGGVNDKGLGGAFSFDWGQVDAFSASLYRTMGTAYIASMRRMEVPAGQSVIYHYTFLPFTGFSALDGMSGDLAGGVSVGQTANYRGEIAEAELKAGATLPVRIFLASGRPRQIKLTFRCVRQEDRKVVMEQVQQTSLAVAQTGTVQAQVILPEDGLYVLTVTADDGAGTLLTMEKGLTVGRTRLSFTATMPAGAKRGVRDAGETMGPGSMDSQFRTLDRSFVTPHLPLAKPDAGGPVKVFFLAPADATLGHVREITQRVDMEYDYFALGKVQMPRDELNFRDLNTFDKRLRQADPPLLVTLGIEWTAGLKRERSRQLLERVRQGMGLVVLERDLQKQTELRDALLTQAQELKDVPLPTTAVDVPPVRLFQLGKGRVAIVVCNWNYYRDAGEAALVGWSVLRTGQPGTNVADIRWRGFEYSYTFLGQVIRWAGGRESTITVTRAELDGDSVRVLLRNAGNAAAGRLRVVARGSRWDELAKGEVNIQMMPGENTPSVQLNPALPGGMVALEVSLRDAQGKVMAFGSAATKVAEQVTIQIVPSAPYQRVGKLGSVKLEVNGSAIRGELEILVQDRFGRQLLRQMHPMELAGNKVSLEVNLKGLEPITIYHEVVARFWKDKGPDAAARLLAQTAQPIFLLPDEPDYAHRFVVAVSGFPGRTPRHLQSVLPQTRALGMTMHSHAYDDLPLYFSGGTKTANVLLRPSKDGRYSVDPQLKQSVDGDTFTMNPPLLPDEASLAASKERWQKAARKAYETGSFLVMIDDERMMSGDFDRSPQTLAGFRRWLETRYADIAQLNRTWGSQFASFGQVIPRTRPEAIESANLAPWLEFRMYIGEVIGHYYMQTPAQWAAEIAPDLSVGELGIYEPSYVWPVDWSKYAQTYKHTQRYGDAQGPLEDLIRSFAPATNHGLWTGYGMRQISDEARLAPWRTLFNGGHFVWYWAMEDNGFWNYAVLGSDQRPTPGYRILAGEEWPDIQNGLDRIVIASRFSTDAIAIGYSYPSWVVDASALATSSKRIVEQLGLQHNYVNLEDVNAGVLEKNAYRILVLQGASCVSTEQAQGLRKFVEGGGVVLVVGKTGWRDLRGAPHASGSVIDDLTGVDMAQAVSVNRLTTARWDEQSIQLHLHSRSVSITNAQVLASADIDGQKNVPVLTQRALGQGRVYWLNTTLAGHDVLHAGDDVDPTVQESPRVASVPLTHWQVFSHIMSQAGIRPRFQLLRKRQPIFDGETYYYQTPSGRSLLVARSLGRLNDQPISVALAKPAYVYEMRSGQFLGQQGTFTHRFPAGRMQVFALLNYTVRELHAQPKLTRVKPGQAVEIACALATQDGSTPDLHAFRYITLDPAGQPMEMYGGTILAPEGKAMVRFPTALNQLPGKYRVQLVDAISHIQTEAAFEVAAP